MSKLYPFIIVATYYSSFVSGNGDCSGFKAAACPLVEENFVGADQNVSDPSVCQQLCIENRQCNFFTHFDDFCYQLQQCDMLSICEICISGPKSPLFSECPWPPETTIFPTTVTSTTVADTTTKATSTTPEATSTTTTVDGESCKEFAEDMTCDIDDANFVDFKHDISVAECQVLCHSSSECNWFTWYSESICWLLRSCHSYEPCPGCISGPGFGADVEDCIAITTSAQQSTTTSMVHTDASSTTEGTTTPAGICSGFAEGACEIDDSNTLDVVHDLTVGQCQDFCVSSEECNFFTWYPSVGIKGICWLLDHCNSLESCPYCVSGPADGTDVDECVSTDVTDTTMHVTDSTTAGTTTDMTTTSAEEGCEVFTAEACDIDESNEIDIVHDVEVSSCQNMCRTHPNCNYFTWNNVYDLVGTC